MARPHLQKLVERARLLPALPAAVVFPVDRDSLQLALSGAFAGYLAPTLVGPDERIRDAANRAGLDISRLTIVDTPDEPRAASERAVALARDGNGRAHSIRGSLAHEDLLAPVADARVGVARRAAALARDVPRPARPVPFPAARGREPQRRAEPRREEGHPRRTRSTSPMRSASRRRTSRCSRRSAPSRRRSRRRAKPLRCVRWRRRARSPGAVVEGPLTPDVALSREAARLHGVKSEIAGRADVLIAPTMEAAIDGAAHADRRHRRPRGRPRARRQGARRACPRRAIRWRSGSRPACSRRSRSRRSNDAALAPLPIPAERLGGDRRAGTRAKAFQP